MSRPPAAAGAAVRRGAGAGAALGGGDAATYSGIVQKKRPSAAESASGWLSSTISSRSLLIGQDEMFVRNMKWLCTR
jgi:hypothetical protein